MGIKRKTTEEFKLDVYNKFSNDFEILGEYINNKTPILIKHNICQKEFKVRPDIFLNNYKKGCPHCNPKKLKTHEIFKKEVFDIYGDEYTLLGKYINADSYIEIRHNVCGHTRSVLAHRILRGDRCPICYGKNIKKTLDGVKEEIKKKTFGDISFIDNNYINGKFKHLFRCNICGKEFTTRVNSILSSNTGCPHCNKSAGETIISRILEKESIEFKREFTFPDLTVKNKVRRSHLRFDFMVKLNDKSVLIEFDGEQHFHKCGRFSFDDVEGIHKRDIIKNKYCLDNNIELMRIPYTEFKKLPIIIRTFLSSTTIPDEFKVVEPSGSKSSATLYDNWKYKADDIV